ncbi:Ldh family oxidoreductase [Sulfitobacter sp. D35]|uniref:Ldh family oxidoreductase n=1 Tax=Sulfitobacter sp. D35 TaxID=3083252 RepID=UPI00296EB502|nr:Ldh family oxidoreductase [Sulfitobacter sp. D35]MDW4499370.1 Ldh family oxidoreductase [Sulfitobacter sp. D35]
MRLTLDQVEGASHAALTSCGASDDQAVSVAASIRDAEAEGTRGIGLGYLPYYCGHLKVGKIVGDALPVLSTPMPGLVGVDAAGGFAHAAYDAGEKVLIEAARRQGIALMGIENAYACGVLGYFTGRLAQHGLIGLMTANASSTMAPWGGREPFFGTNPWSFAAPRAGAPLIIDSSSSATAFVNIANAAAAGEQIPDTWALDPEGRPTTDPTEGMAGSIAPAGGHKGAALALMVEVLSAGLTRSNWSHEASSLGDDAGGPPRLGQTLIAIRPDGLGRPDFAERLDGMLAEMTREAGTRVPGDRRHDNRAAAERDGVTVDAALIETLNGFGAGL